MRKRTVVAAIVVVALAVVVGLYVVLDRLSRGLSLRLTPDACTVRVDQPVTLKPEQMANAATIAAVGLRRGLPERALVVALATALQESKLQNLSAGDRDSLGLFQQRPSQGWGSVQQIADPRYAAGQFYSALLKVRGWETMPVTQAAQAVQHSAQPDAYQKWQDEAGTLARALSGDAGAALACTLRATPKQHGAAATGALAHNLRLDWGEIDTTPAVGVPGLTVAAVDERSGWRYAGWLVAHAQDQSIKRVRFLDREWNARDGTWVRVDATSTTSTSDIVLAEVWG